MHNLGLIEEYYKKITNNLSDFLPEGLQNVDLDFLHMYDLLHYHHKPEVEEENLTRYFHVLESPEKITLINDEFIIWIIPSEISSPQSTYALIALNNASLPILQTGFVAKGIYNTSHLVLKVLEKLLIEIQDTENLIQKYEPS